MNLQDRIEVNLAICGGRPRVKGTRLTVEFVPDMMAAGWSEAQIFDNRPHLTKDDLQAVATGAKRWTGATE